MLALGSPPLTFALIVDTGSTITYVPCSSCATSCGPHHQVKRCTATGLLPPPLLRRPSDHGILDSCSCYPALPNPVVTRYSGLSIRSTQIEATHTAHAAQRRGSGVCARQRGAAGGAGGGLRSLGQHHSGCGFVRRPPLRLREPRLRVLSGPAVHLHPHLRSAPPPPPLPPAAQRQTVTNTAAHCTRPGATPCCLL